VTRPSTGTLTGTLENAGQVQDSAPGLGARFGQSKSGWSWSSSVHLACVVATAWRTHLVKSWRRGDATCRLPECRIRSSPPRRLTARHVPGAPRALLSANAEQRGQSGLQQPHQQSQPGLFGRKARSAAVPGFPCWWSRACLRTLGTRGVSRWESPGRSRLAGFIDSAQALTVRDERTPGLAVRSGGATCCGPGGNAFSVSC
jgi:hypothetical protein